MSEPTQQIARPRSESRPRTSLWPRTVAVMAMLILSILLAWSASPATAVSAPLAITQCNGTDNVGGESVACDVTVVNNLNVATGLTSSVVTVRECHGAANTVPTCTTTPSSSNRLTTTVNQCNGSGSGAGGTVTCTVHILNNITGVSASTPATINQCNGSGTGGGTAPTTVCVPLGNTTNATITQCNTSGNGGGGTMRVRCTVTPSTQAAALPVTVDQCNGSGNGGGATVTCTTSLVNNVFPGAVTSSPAASTSATSSAAAASTPATTGTRISSGARTTATTLSGAGVSPRGGTSLGGHAVPGGSGTPSTALASTGAALGYPSLASLTAIVLGVGMLLLARPKKHLRRH